MRVKCRTLYNKEKYVEPESLIQRPSVYGLVIADGKLLVVKAQHTQRYVLPGGGIEKGEHIEAALIREVMEETGIAVDVAEFLHFESDFFYYDPLDMAIHGFLFFYRCISQSTELGMPDYPPEEGLERPLWVDISDLDADQFQTHGQLTMQWLTQVAS